MIIRSIALTNFLGYRRRCAIDFGGRRTIGIVGPNESGKSTILQGIAYALYGRVPGQGDAREIELRSTGSTSDMIVEVEVELAGDKLLSITRGRTKDNQPILRLAGHAGKPSELDRDIESYLGYPFSDFVSLSYFVQGDIHQFLAGDKRAYFTRWAQSLRLWDRYEEALKQLIRELERAQEKVDADFQRASAHASQEAWAAAKVDLVRAKKEVRIIAAKVRGAETSIEAISKELEGISSEDSELRQRLKSLETERAFMRDRVDTLRRGLRDKRRYQQSLDRSICPILKHKCSALAKHVSSELAEDREEYAAFQQSLASAESRLKKVEAQLADDAAACSALPQYQVRPQARLKKEKRALQELRAQLGQAQKRVGRAEAAMQDVKRASEELEWLRKRRSGLEVRMRRAQFLRFMCSKNGIQAELLQKELMAVEQRCNWVLEGLDYPKRIKFEAYKELAGYERVCPQCGCDRWVKGLCAGCSSPRPRKRKNEPTLAILDGMAERVFPLESGGAKVLQSFAVRLACSQLVADLTGTQVKLILLDEVFAMLDPSNRQKLMSLVIDRLSSQFGLEQQIIVSHHDDISNAVDNILLVHKSGGTSLAEWA